MPNLFRRNQATATEEQNEQATLKLQDLPALEHEIAQLNLIDAPKSTIVPANELYFLEISGYQVIQIVFGNVVYSMGARGLVRSFQRAFKQGEMSDYTRMNKDARQIALTRMLVSAHNLGADSVIGVSFDIREWADFLEITATGTAVKRVRPMDKKDIAVSP